MIVSGYNFLLLTLPGPFKLVLFDIFGHPELFDIVLSFKLNLEQLSWKKLLKLF